jgi:hypothetical protein
MSQALLLHPITERHFKQLIQNAPHAVLITGEFGSGKGSVARALVQEILGEDDISQSPYVRLLADDGKQVPIESIRQLQHFLQLRVPGKATIRRAIIIENAARLSAEAQNTLLKTLEEPPLDTVIILTVRQTDNVLPTISSRTQHLQVTPVSLAAAASFFTNYPPEEVTKNYHLSGGCVGLLSVLLDANQAHPLVQQVNTAKQLLKAPVFERLTLIEPLSRDKGALPEVLWALQRVSHAALQQAVKGNNQHLIHHWQRVLQALIDAQDKIAGNPQPKLLLANLFLSL